MGCTSSKQLRRSRGRSPSPCARCQSLPVHFAANGARSRIGDGHHAVALTSSTLGSLVLERGYLSSDDEAAKKSTTDLPLPLSVSQADIERKLGRAKTWSEMIERRIPATPSMTPPNEPEVINAWELMAGLEDTSPLHLRPAAVVTRSFSNTSPDARYSCPDSELSSCSSLPKLEWMKLCPDDPVFSDFDPEILSSFRKTLNDPSLVTHKEDEDEDEDEDEVEHEHENEDEDEDEDEDEEKEELYETPKSISIVRVRINEFQQQIDARRTNGGAKPAVLLPSYTCPPGGEGKVVSYFTSLRGIRKTYEDCLAVRMILKSYGVRVDERDVSMHAGYKAELVDILGSGYGGNRLPRVFAEGSYLGGAEEVRQLHELGRLGKFLECCEMVPAGKGSGGGGHEACEGCGDVRFVPCDACSGSCKVFVEEEAELGGFRRCSECNENGLVRCSLCY